MFMLSSHHVMVLSFVVFPRQYGAPLADVVTECTRDWSKGLIKLAKEGDLDATYEVPQRHHLVLFDNHLS